MNPIVDQDAARMRALVIDCTGDQELADQVAEAVVNAHRLGQMSGLDYAARRLEALAAEAAVAAGDTGHRWHRWAAQAYRIAGAALRMDWHAIRAEGGAR